MDASSGFCEGNAHLGVWRNGRIETVGPAVWPEGMRFRLLPLPPAPEIGEGPPFVVIAGFGLPGRYIAELLDEWSVPYSIIDRNPSTIRTQRALGRRAVEGDAAKETVLREAGLPDASMLALTIPEQTAVERACVAAKALKPGVHVIARVAFASKGMRAAREGADEVIVAEQEVALRFHERMTAWLTARFADALTVCASDSSAGSR